MASSLSSLLASVGVLNGGGGSRKSGPLPHDNPLVVKKEGRGVDEGPGEVLGPGETLLRELLLAQLAPE